MAFICDYCGAEERGKGYLQRHIDQKHRTFICIVCNQVYSQKPNLLEHLKIHFEKFVCQYCGLELSKLAQFQKHILQQHEPDNQQLILSIRSNFSYNCRYCVRNFPTAVHRNCHEINIHKGRTEAAFKCKVCNLIFITKEQLRLHSFEHYSGTLHFCAFPGCDRYFKTIKQLKNHNLIHGPAKFKCEKCNQKFSQSANHAKHKKRCKGHPKDELKNLTEEEHQQIMKIAKEQFLSFGGKLDLPVKKISPAVPKVAVKRGRGRPKTKKTAAVDDTTTVEYLEDCLDEIETTDIINVSTNSEHVPNINRSIEFEKIFMEEERAEEQNSLSEEHTRIKRKSTRQSTKKNRDYVCDICAYQATSHSALKVHLATHEIQSCRYCNETFNKKVELNRHMRLTHDFGKKKRQTSGTTRLEYVCDHCGLTAPKMYLLRQHMKQHIQPEEECGICHQKFRFVERHIRNVHSFDRPFQCAICGAKFKGRHNLNSHIKTHDKPTECPICHKFLPNMQRHLHWHKTPKSDPFKCRQCDKLFSTKQAAQEHIARIHERRPSGKSYACEVCELKFIRSRDLRLHSFIHFSGKIFACDFLGCNEMFKKKFKLHAHMLVHSSEKEANFECGNCSKKYLRRTALNKHLRMAHSQQPESNMLSINIVKRTIGHQLE